MLFRDKDRVDELKKAVENCLNILAPKIANVVSPEGIKVINEYQVIPFGDRALAFKVTRVSTEKYKRRKTEDKNAIKIAIVEHKEDEKGVTIYYRILTKEELLEDIVVIMNDELIFEYGYTFRIDLEGASTQNEWVPFYKKAWVDYYKKVLNCEPPNIEKGRQGRFGVRITEYVYAFLYKNNKNEWMLAFRVFDDKVYCKNWRTLVKYKVDACILSYNIKSGLIRLYRGGYFVV